MAEPPLKGIRVIELARILAGPWAGQLLADLGADVIKVESPDGDDTRKWGPPFVAGHDGENLSAAYYHACNRGKRSIVVDFSTPAGAATLRKLVAGPGLARRRALKRLSYSLPARPLMRFIYQYVLRGGMFDGPGAWRYCRLLARYERIASAEIRRQRAAAHA